VADTAFVRSIGSPWIRHLAVEESALSSENALVDGPTGGDRTRLSSPAVAVSRENVELMQRITEAVNAPDPGPLLAPLLAPGYYIENIVTAVTDKTYYGVAGCLEWWEDTVEAFAPRPRYELEEVIAQNDDLVVARLAFIGKGAQSDAPLELRWIATTWFEDGKATRSAGYAHRREALEAVGLAE
jgi:hypothetical protein